MTSTNGKLRPTDGSWLAGFDAALDVVDQRIDREEIVRGRTISHRTVDPEPGDSTAGTSAFYPGHQAGGTPVPGGGRCRRRCRPPPTTRGSWRRGCSAAQRTASTVSTSSAGPWARVMTAPDQPRAALGVPRPLARRASLPGAKVRRAARCLRGIAWATPYPGGKGRCVAEATRRDIDIDVPVPRPRRRPDRRGRHVPHGGRGLRRRASRTSTARNAPRRSSATSWIRWNSARMPRSGRSSKGSSRSSLAPRRATRWSYAGHGWRSIGPCGCSLRRGCGSQTSTRRRTRWKRWPRSTAS